MYKDIYLYTVVKWRNLSSGQIVGSMGSQPCYICCAMDEDPQQKKIVVPIRPDAKVALDQSLREMPGGMKQIEVISQLVLWFAAQPSRTKTAVLCAGAGLPVEDAGQAREMVDFGEGRLENRDRSRSSDPPQAGERARPAA